jgi:hypothetical protein
MKRWSIFKRYGYLWVTGVIFALTFGGHWLLAWNAYVDEQEAHGQPPEARGYLLEVGRDTLENWQSEFLQLMWQVAGLAFLFHVGSPQSKEGDERLEEKVDELLRQAKGGEAALKRLDRKYPRA